VSEEHEAPLEPAGEEPAGGDGQEGAPAEPEAPAPLAMGDRLRALVQRESLLRLAGRALPLPVLVLLIAAEGSAGPTQKFIGALLFTPLVLLPSLAELHAELAPRASQRLFVEALLAALLGFCVCAGQLVYLGELFRSGDVQKALQQAASLLELDPWILRVLAVAALACATPLAAAAALRARSSGEPLWRRTAAASLCSMACGLAAFAAFLPLGGVRLRGAGATLEFVFGFALGALAAALVLAAWSAAVDWLARRVFRERGRLA